MSNANRIHLLSLAASTLSLMAHEYNNEDAKKALKAVLSHITLLTETGDKGEGDVGTAQVAEPQPEVAQDLRSQPACGCGDPGCALLDVLLGKRTDYNVADLVNEFKRDLGLKDTAQLVINVLNFIQEKMQSKELFPTPGDLMRLAELAQVGENFAKGLPEQPRKDFEVHVIDGSGGLEAVLEQIFGKGKGETRH